MTFEQVVAWRFLIVLVTACCFGVGALLCLFKLGKTLKERNKFLVEDGGGSKKFQFELGAYGTGLLVCAVASVFIIKESKLTCSWRQEVSPLPHKM